MVFEAVLLFPIKGAHFLYGDSIWPLLEKVTTHVSSMAGKVAQWAFTGKKMEPLLRTMSFIDWVEGLVGVYGEWERVDEKTAIKRVHSCRYAKKWGEANKFCTILGGVMGKEALSALYPGRKVDFEVRSAISQGSPFCEYLLRVE